ncbi:MAG: 1-deoxy-D-xylulose-5-phosphate reductoisomerase [Acidobacteriota bacterium]|nr:1-deoxy-D-xylulose-5-phosphate reductoisomerase [Acidobacteriota bacterium]OQB57741.1 MAG: 1-deoxy-D-xylulose 5-phosphate reductoisomerase [Candidatus Aminicenantes bacterium ADurb.Bin147]HNQ81442.1 1-deoxy-D-xylulose-5-phosphate reductoisomerase [Candidatus Aminicenantes bacterium]MDD8011255.1 1-deoxy-D-xylulose-5-phosphate reductoisomerase [Acidobacteriota bacterium]MDD8030093.1 1-deoxy-D-xylulose-5-phosphate reductoisomerase [Acidobacteriota bacterium]
MRKIAVLGSTGTIGRNTLDIVRRHRRLFKVTALAAGSNRDLLLSQIVEFRPLLVSVGTDADAAALRRELGRRGPDILSGAEGASAAAAETSADLVVSAIAGFNGLRPTLAAVRAGKTVALANKESLVAAGGLLRREAKNSGAVFIPVDSEHSGIFQCLAGIDRGDIRSVVLTASGGPFLRIPLRELRRKTPEEALAHPRWTMGRKVTIDSATMMNKGLELIEARWLFDLAPDMIRVLIHPQSIVHALVELRDGSVLAQLSRTDMRIPIQYALTYPRRRDGFLPPLDLAASGPLEFSSPDERRFPLLKTARRVMGEKDSAAVAMNAANEIAVEAFLGARLRFNGIAETVEEALAGLRPRRLDSLDDIIEEDRRIRERTRRRIEKRT